MRARVTVIVVVAMVAAMRVRVAVTVAVAAVCANDSDRCCAITGSKASPTATDQMDLSRRHRRL